MYPGHLESMYRYIYILVLVLLSQGRMAAQCEDYPVAFRNGEKVTYKVYYNWKFIWIPAGEVVFEVFENDSMYEFRSTGYSYPAYDSFFKVRDNYYSQVTKADFSPVTFRRDILEGHYERFDSISFDHDNKILTEYFGLSRDRCRKVQLAFEECVHDMLSIVYYFRNLPDDMMQEGRILPVHVAFDMELFHLDVAFKGSAKKKIKGLGQTMVWHIQPELVSGYVFTEGSLMDIWVSADKNKLPLLVESPLRVGKIRAILKNHLNLKHAAEYINE